MREYEKFLKRCDKYIDMAYKEQRNYARPGTRAWLDYQNIIKALQQTKDFCEYIEMGEE